MPTFSREFPGPDEDCSITAEVHRGGVTFIVYTSNMQHGGTGSSSRTFEEVLAGKVPWHVTPDLLAEVQEAVRAMPTDDSPDGWTPEGDTLLEAAAFKENRAEIERLLRAGADVNAKSAYGRTALRAAALRRNAELVELLLASGAKVGGDIVLAECFMWRQKHALMMKHLVAAGAKVTAADIEKACACEDPATLEVFLAARPDLRAALEALLLAVRAVDDANRPTFDKARAASAREDVRKAWAKAAEDLKTMLFYEAAELSSGTFAISRCEELADKIQKLLGR